MTKERLALGKLGEDLAFKKIKRLGYKRIVRNYRCPLGEVDLIARDDETLVFIEIKTRKGSKSAGRAKEAVDERKKRQLSRVALAYMKSHECIETKARFDVVAVSFEGDRAKIEVVKNAFDLDY